MCGAGDGCRPLAACRGGRAELCSSPSLAKKLLRRVALQFVRARSGRRGLKVVAEAC